MTATATQPNNILVAGQWVAADATDSYSSINPATGEKLDELFPVSRWSDIDKALDAARDASRIMRTLPPQPIAEFLNRYADAIEAHTDDISAIATLETGLPVKPRIADVELPRTVSQIRQSAAACLDGSWRLPVVDSKNNISSVLEPIGPVLVFGPNNFPLAFNGISGGDFASAIAAGNPVIAKGHRSHSTTTRMLAELAHESIGPDMPAATVQLLYGMKGDDGLRMVADARLGAVGFTGSRRAGTALKQSADAVGKPIYLEMSSINPVVFLPGALGERFDDILSETATSGLMAAGQFCTKAGLLITVAGDTTDRFVAGLVERYKSSPCATLLGEGVMNGLTDSVGILKSAGVEVLAGGSRASREGFAFDNTILRTTGDKFLADPHTLQTEAFGNCTLVVDARDEDQVCQIVSKLEGNLTGSVYSATDGSEEASYQKIEPLLRERVGRLLNDKMPTGVAVSPAMNHGGPFPATGHPHFTAVGVPASLRRFTRLACYDNVRPGRLPQILRS